MNGALTIGTLDGANIEIREEVGADDIFIFGLTVDEVRRIRTGPGYRPAELYQSRPAVRRVLDAIGQGRFCPREPGRHGWVPQRLLAAGEPYFHLADLESYLAAQAEASRSLPGPAGLGRQGDPQRGPRRQVLQRPHHPRLRAGRSGTSSRSCLTSFRSHFKTPSPGICLRKPQGKQVYICSDGGF